MTKYSKPGIFTDAKTHHNNGDLTGVSTHKIEKQNGDTIYEQWDTRYSGLAQGHVETKKINTITVDEEGNQK